MDYINLPASLLDHRIHPPKGPDFDRQSSRLFAENPCAFHQQSGKQAEYSSCLFWGGNIHRVSPVGKMIGQLVLVLEHPTCNRVGHISCEHYIHVSYSTFRKLQWITV